MTDHLFYLALRDCGLSIRQANILVNRAKRADLGDYQPAMLALVGNGASMGVTLDLCRWAKRNQVRPSWLAKRALLFTVYRHLGESAVTMYIHESIVR